jgi:hypothetical protein
MNHPDISASEALRKLRKVGGKGDSGPTVTPPTGAATQRSRVFDSRRTLTSLGSGEIERQYELDETKYENIQLKVEKSLTCHIENRFDQIRSRQDNWHMLVLAVIAGITFVAWLYWQGKFDSFTERLVKLESIADLAQGQSRPDPGPKNSTREKQ